MSSLSIDQNIQLCLGINDMFSDNTRFGDTKTMSHGVFYFEVLMLNHLRNCVNGIIDFQILQHKLFFNFKDTEMAFLFRYPWWVLLQNSNTHPKIAPINPPSINLN
jgi:hypothetical protein